MQSLARALMGLVVLLLLGSLGGGCTNLPALRGFGGWFRERAPKGRALSSAFPSRFSLEHLQVKGSHNSYHRAPRFSLSRTWRYTHAPIDVQLGAQGVRQLELDVRYDRGEVVVSHLPVIDGRSNCRTLRDCLGELKHWSRKNPAHLPVFVFIEPKEHVAPSQLDGRLDVIDGTIRRVFPREDLLIPEDVVGDAASLSEAIEEHGWPSIEWTRGKIAFVLFGSARHPREYARGRPRLEGRTMFVATESHQLHSSVFLYDDPVRSAASIERAVRRSYLVRTRADANLVRDVGRRDAALWSGAHFIASDFVDPRYNWLELGQSAPVRCNPVSAPERCTPERLAVIEQALWMGLSR